MGSGGEQSAALRQAAGDEHGAILALSSLAGLYYHRLNDPAAARKAFEEAKAIKGKPTCIIAHTIKGKGVSFMENNPKFHGVAPTQDELKLALQELN